MSDNNTKYLGYALIGGLAYYLYRTGKNKGVKGLNHIEGINIEIQPEKLLEKARKKVINMNPQHRDFLFNAAKGIVRGYNSRLNNKVHEDEEYEYVYEDEE